MHKSILSFNCDKKYVNTLYMVQQIADVDNIKNSEYKNIVATLLQDVNTNRFGQDKLFEDMIEAGSNKLDIVTDKKLLATLINKTHCELLKFESTGELAITIGDNVASALICKIRVNGINEPVVLANVYMRPPGNKPEYYDISQFIQDFQNATKPEGWSRLIMMGDINGIDPLWCPPDKILTFGNHLNSEHTNTYLNRLITRGRAVQSGLVRRMRLRCLNDIERGPTRINMYGIGTYINICFAGEKSNRKWKSVDIMEPPNNAITATHKILVLRGMRSGKEATVNQTGSAKSSDEIEVNTNLKESNKRKSTSEEARKCKRIETEANKKSIQDTVLMIPNDWLTRLDYKTKIALMNHLSIELYKYLEVEQSNNKKSKNNNQKPKYRDHNSIQLKMAKRLKKLKSNTNKYHRYKNEIINYAKQYCERVMNSSDTVRQYTDTDYVWNEIHAIKDLLEIDTSIERNTKLDDDIYIEKLDTIAEEKFPHLEARRESLRSVFKAEMKEQTNVRHEVISEREIEISINEMRGKKHTGIEGIKFQTFYDSICRSAYVKKVVITIVQLSRYTCRIPINCRTNLGKIIPKKQPGKFRIVHLATPLSSLIEQTVLHELEHALEYHNKIDNSQYGFTKCRGRHDLVTRIFSNTLYNKLINSNTANTTIISLDVKGAFDNVNQSKLISKMFKDLCPMEGKCIAEHNHSFMVSWLANFLLYKDVILNYKGKRTEARAICQGVPQGSCLGPILWNFMIESLTTELNKKYNSINYELLSYADDIILCMRNIGVKTKQILQERTDEFVQELAKLDLEIEAQKCSLMFIHVNKYIRDMIKVRINKVKIKTVDTMSILGVNFTKTLRFDYKILGESENLIKNTYLLQKIQALGIIKETAVWKVLINSLIKSIIISNNFPILALDRVSRVKVEKEFAKAVKFIFTWSPFTSNKTVRMLTHQVSIRTQILKLIYKNKHYETSNAYKLLHRIVQNDINIYHKQDFTTDSVGSDLIATYESEQSTCQRRTADPSKMLVTNTISLLKDICPNEQVSRFWYTFVYANVAIIALIKHDNEKRMIWFEKVEKISRQEYSISYFNQMSAIYELTELNKELNCNNLILSPKNGLFQALANHSNTDYRVIELRERLFDQGIVIQIANKETIEIQLKNRMKLNSLNIRVVTHPNVTDYMLINEERKMIEAIENRDLTENINSFCKSISADPKLWSNVNPNSISGRRMVMLSGNITYKKKMVHHNKTEYKCGCTKDEITTDNIIVHRAMECKNNLKYRENCNEPELKLISMYHKTVIKQRALEMMLNNNMTHGCLFKMLIDNACLE